MRRKVKTLQEHQHILVDVPGTRHQHLRCCLPGCSYSEYWNHATQAYAPHLPAVYGIPDTKANKRKLTAASAAAIRPHSLWETSAPDQAAQEQTS